jgi:hypothetical protein
VHERLRTSGSPKVYTISSFWNPISHSVVTTRNKDAL